uniref:Protein kinase domain-containing protein n=1 Tax=Plectus sambesii TaxID=2011161 RepID=A0A914VAD9_9BILA
MNKGHSKYSTDESEEENDNIRLNENSLNCYDEYQEGYTSILDKLDNEALDENFEIEPDTLTIIKAIGRGHFSDVHMGILSLLTKRIPVAVKTTHMRTYSMNAVESEDILGRQREMLRDELRMFAHLQSSSAGGHENILKLLGAITTIETDFCLVTEYCECGSLDCFLQAKWKNGDFEDELVFEGNENEKVWKIQRVSDWGKNYQSRRDKGLITTSDLLWFALQIARAMQFLASMNVIHRDIALRSILLKSDFTVKVAGFGLSRKLKECDDAYYTESKDAPLPIRQTAPESLKSGQFAITSEYWSFGVVIWELFTFAEKQPYSVELDDYEMNGKLYEILVEHLLSGQRLSIPNNVPQQM